MVGVFKAYAVTHDGAYHLVDGGILGDDATLQLVSHALQTDALVLTHALHRNAGHH